jgi:diguanylate cyclase (GGDEF)-like protein
MAHQASYDALTGLPNRRLFNNRLQEEISKAERKNHHLAVLFIDLDHFKEVNDTLGHKIGDSLLIHAAHRIQNCVRQSDTVARLGGDEFVVILPELSKFPPVERTAEAIIRAMMQPFKLGEYQSYVSASVGIAVYPQDANNAETLVSCADQAMYSAKEAGRNSFNFFTRSMQEQAQQRLYLVNSLRDALEKNQFEVYYQPIIEVASGKTVKAEALLRWHHPVLGMVSPEIFIPLAEETDLIQGIGSWVFCQAADMAKHWNTLSGANELRKVSINMSPRQLIKGCGDQIAIDYLQTIALDSTHIVIEITEGLLLDDCPHITEKLERLRTGGIQLSLDDFGTGYSAMAYLRKFDINYLKIDRSFVCDLETNADDRAITEAIVMMAHRLGLKVIAEGVETAGQYELLAAIGCEYIQGYFYAKPMPIENFLSYVFA